MPRARLLFTAGLVLAARAPAAEPDDPAAELASFQVASGFEVHLFASEKDGVVKPIQIRFDALGRLWVIGSTVYPQIEPGQTPDDRVLVLEDTDGDGRPDRTTVFADGLMIPTGIELGDGGAYVGHGTELLFLRDTDGDGKADERRVVLRGFGTGDNHQNINSFLWGPGGELWMCQGLHIRSHVETPWGIARLEQAGIWRLRPRRLQLEGFYGSEHEPQNPWGFVFTDWGEPIVMAGNNSSPIYPVPGLVVTHRDDAPALIWKDGQGRKVSGCDLVGTSHFPDAWQGVLITGGYINNAVWALKLTDDGAGFRLEDLPPLIRSTSRSFRPVDVKFGPDGALYICDWYNPIIGHYQASFRHPDRDKTHGRIWRVTATGRALTLRPQLAGLPARDIAERLSSPDRWTRHFAKRVLADMSKADALGAVAAFAARPGVSDRDLKEALGVYQSHEEVERDLLVRLASAKEAGARAYAASAAGLWADRLADPLVLLRRLAADESARVRLQAVVACARVPRAGAMEAALLAADAPIDKFIDYALGQVVFALKPHWLPVFRRGGLDLGGSAARLSALVRADGTADTLDAVRTLARSRDLDPAAREPFLKALAELGGPEDVAAILGLEDPGLLARVLPALVASARSRGARPAGDAAALLAPHAGGARAELRAGSLRLAGLWRIEGLRSAAEAAALDAGAHVEVRRAAMEALAAFGGETSREVLSRLAGDGPWTSRSMAIASLCPLDLNGAATLAADSLVQGAPGGPEDDAAWDEVYGAFLDRRNGAAALAQALGSRTPSRRAAECGLRAMSASGRRDEGLARILARAAGLAGEGRTLAVEEIPALAAGVRSAGDAKRGEEVFQRPVLGCVACHSVRGRGGRVGPDLSAVGTAQPVDFILGAIIDPQKEVKEGFVAMALVTSDGQVHQGYPVRESPEEIVLRDALRGEELRLRRDAVIERRQVGSLMPSGLAESLTRAELCDLVRYLSELGGK